MAADGTRFAVTGHRAIANEAAVRDAAVALLGSLPAPLVCVSSLAEGADQLVARLALEAGGTLHVVIPASGYEQSLPRAARDEFESLCRAAESTMRLAHAHPSPTAYADAGRRMLDGADLLIAVWDGGPSRGGGGTADVVRMARSRGIPVHVLPAVRLED